jgi:hypothetical protein
VQHCANDISRTSSLFFSLSSIHSSIHSLPHIISIARRSHSTTYSRKAITSTYIHTYISPLISPHTISPLLPPSLASFHFPRPSSVLYRIRRPSTYPLCFLIAACSIVVSRLPSSSSRPRHDLYLYLYSWRPRDFYIKDVNLNWTVEVVVVLFLV